MERHSRDGSQDNIARIRSLFPGCVTEAVDHSGKLTLAVDVDRLRQELSDHIVEGPQERYRFDWPGKREAMVLAKTPIAKTLRPARDESVAFDTTKNLFIEGDNLDALKLLQDTCLGKVKMIYIDPPYNTGSHLIYKNNYSERPADFLERSGQRDEDARTEGRFHSHWLSMMTSRLSLARTLLEEDGVLFMSIDDREVHNLRKAADDIFDERNFVANVIWEKKYSRANDAKWFSSNHDHILVYARNKDVWQPTALPRTDDQNRRYANRDNDPRGPWKSTNLSVRSWSANRDYEITTPSGRVVSPPHGRCWGHSRERFKDKVNDNRIWFGKDGSNIPSVKSFLSEVKDGLVPLTIWKYGDVGHNQDGRMELKKLFDDRVYFDSPKPVSLLRRMIHLSGAADNDIILDFFAGSGTTAHAVLEANAEEGVNRRFIVVQWAEDIEKWTFAGKAGFGTIADITKERMRRAGKKILAAGSHADWNRDVGFRVMKIDTSNRQDV